MLKPNDIFDLGTWEPYTCTEAPPAYSVVGFNGGSRSGRHFVNTIEKPGTTSRHKYGIVYPSDGLGSSSTYRGLVCTAGMALAKYSDSSLAVGDRVGPTSGAWTVSKSGTGFLVRGVPDTTNKIALIEHDPYPPEHYYEMHDEGDSTTYDGASWTSDLKFERIPGYVDPSGATSDSACYGFGIKPGSGSDQYYRAVIKKAGKYQINVYAEVQYMSGGGSTVDILRHQTVQFEVYRNNAEFSGIRLIGLQTCHSFPTQINGVGASGTANPFYSVSFSKIRTLAVDDYLTLRASDTQDTHSHYDFKIPKRYMSIRELRT